MPTHYIIGVDADGQSKVVETRPTGGQMIDRLWATERLPAEIPVPLRDEDEQPLDIGVSATGSGFLSVQWQPNGNSPMHRTDTIDYGVCLEGELILELDIGEVRMQTGDTVMIPGVRHGWRSEDTTPRYVLTAISLAR